MKESSDQEKKSQTYIFEASHSIPKDMVIDCRVVEEGTVNSIEFHVIIGSKTFLTKSYYGNDEISDHEIKESFKRFLESVVTSLIDEYGFNFKMKEVYSNDKVIQLAGI